jgi:hypothetical protein
MNDNAVLLDDHSAFHHRDVAWERAEERVIRTGGQFRHIEGHRIFLAGTNDLGVGDDAIVTLFQVVLVDASGHAISGNRLHVGGAGQHPVMTHDVFRQAAGVSQLDGERLAALVDRDFLGVEGHLVSGVDGDLALCSKQLAASQGRV